MKKTKFIVILCVAIVFIMFGLKYFNNEKSENNQAEWKVFNDKNLGIQVKVPQDWTAQRANLSSGSPMLALETDKFAELSFKTPSKPIKSFSEVRNARSTEFDVSRYHDPTNPNATPATLGYLDKSFVQKLPNGIQVYILEGRMDQYASEDDIYVQNGSEWYVLVFFIQNRGRNGFTPEEKILEQRILSNFKFIDPATITQSKLDVNKY